jgi:Fumarylacetoacetate (FAA) hydrolase family
VVPAWLIEDPDVLSIRCWVNGILKQNGNTKDMVNDIRQLIAAASTFVTLEPGDVIATGTPSGVGVPKGEQLVNDDEVVIEIESIGRLANPVAVTVEAVAPHGLARSWAALAGGCSLTRPRLGRVRDRTSSPIPVSRQAWSSSSTSCSMRTRIRLTWLAICRMTPTGRRISSI